MSSRSSVFIATSLDGFIARTDGSLDWLDSANAAVSEGEDCGYSAFMASIDALIMGRKTYEQVLSFGQEMALRKHAGFRSESQRRWLFLMRSAQPSLILRIASSPP